MEIFPDIRQADIRLQSAHLQFRIYNDHLIRVISCPAAVSKNSESIILDPACHDARTQTLPVKETNGTFQFETDELTVVVDKASGSVDFLDLSGKSMVRENGVHRKFKDNGSKEKTSGEGVEAVFEPSQVENLYGLGQHPGIFNYRTRSIPVVQVKNRTVTPFFLSTAGYGILWLNESATSFANKAAAIPMELTETGEAADEPGDQARTGYFTSDEAGEYTFRLDTFRGARLWVDGRKIIDQAQGWADAVDADFDSAEKVAVEEPKAKQGIAALRIGKGEHRISCRLHCPEAVNDAYLLIGYSSCCSRTFRIRVDGDEVINFDDPEITFPNTWKQEVHQPEDVEWISAALNRELAAGEHEVELIQDAQDNYLFRLHGIAVTGSGHSRDRASGSLELPAGKQVEVKLDYSPAICRKPPRLTCLFPAAKTVSTIKSERGGALDYFFIYGPGFDKIISGCRQVTGNAPMFPKYAFGFIQSKERYSSAAEVLSVVQNFRRRRFPLDVIVQDWRYWDPYPWGSHRFDPDRYPDPKGLIEEIHSKYQARFMISVWPCFEKGSDNYTAMKEAGMLFLNHEKQAGQESKKNVFAFNPFFETGGHLYWGGIKKHLFDLGVDAFWVDNPEPMGGADFEQWETDDFSGADHRNTYPLMLAKAIYEGWRGETDDKRVFVLSRSGFAGQQRFAAATWSGDIPCTWEELQRQIPAGLNYCMAGLPYWTTDIGGFFHGPEEVNDAYAELFVRWFQYGAFCPLFRVHGSRPGAKEPWRFGEPGTPYYDALLRAAQLRYRLLPYIYSLAWKVTSEDYTLMRALVMDFPRDEAVFSISDQFMFGPAIMVCPVTSPAKPSRKVYLPEGQGWYDFWSGQLIGGGGTEVSTSAPLSVIPLFIRAGAIIPMGPMMQFTDEKKADPLEIRIYAGADGEFTLYEDEGDNYNYEKGNYSTIPFRWDDRKQFLYIGERQGEFPGMPRSRTFRLVIVGRGRGTGVEETEHADATVRYTGASVEVNPFSQI